MAFGIDFSDSRPSHAAMKTAGVRFVVRYVGSKVHGSGRDAKWLSPAEATSLHKGGFDLVAVFETTAQRADGGRSAGLADAHTAVAELAYCGLPAALPVYFAVDWDTTVGPLITAYFNAIAEVLGRKRTGAYGGYHVIKALLDKKLITYAWQTYAWSGDSWDGRNHLEQYSNGRRIGGADVDYDRSKKSDFGQWRASAPPAEEDEMIAGRVEPSGQTVAGWPGGKFSAIGFSADPGYLKLGQAKLRVALHRTTGSWQIEHVTVGPATVDGETLKAVVHFTDKAHTDFVAITRETGDSGAAVSFDAS